MVENGVVFVHHPMIHIKGDKPVMSIELDELSRIGFGGYRISIGSAEHARALSHALRSGCNLIDTSANYMNGESEMLVGKVLSENPDLDAFVITKAGYIQGDNLNVISELNRKGLARDGLIIFSEEYQYSIHPDFLQSQIELSCQRLQRERIDGFLLHNPEHYFEQDTDDVSPDEFYTMIANAFKFLEEMVAAGVIRYYGISSNTFPFSTEAENTTDLHQVMKIARTISSSHHFKLIQFPFNLIEQQALDAHHGGMSLIDAARSYGIVTLSNRPINARRDNQVIRLASYDDEMQSCDDEEAQKIFDTCIDLVQQQLIREGADGTPMDYTPMRFLRDAWTTLSTPELVTSIFQTRIYPFLDALYDGSIPDDAGMAFARLQYYAILYAKKGMSEQSQIVRRQLIRNGRLRRDDTRPFTRVACDYYLASGVDHVLAGMKRVAYVDDLKELFQRRTTSGQMVS